MAEAQEVQGERYDIAIVVGHDYFYPLIEYKTAGEEPEPIDITDHTVRMQVKVLHSDEEAVLDLSTEEGGGITLVPLEGKINIHATNAKTALMPQHESGVINGVYDIFLYEPEGGLITRLLYGRCKIHSRSTIPPGP